MVVGVLVVIESPLKGAVKDVVKLDSVYRGMMTSLMGRPEGLMLMGLEVAEGNGSNRSIRRMGGADALVLGSSRVLLATR